MAVFRTATLVCLAALCHQVAAFTKISDVPLTELDEKTGKHFVATVTGKKWSLYESKEHGKVFFVEQSSQNSTWDDPRSLPLTDEERATLPPEIVALHDKRMFEEGALTANGMPARSSSAVVTVVAIVPLVLFAAVMAGRIWYLQTYYPELLFPTKERKSRVKGSAKFKAQKARGKMSQDGKGGRSNNTQ